MRKQKSLMVPNELKELVTKNTLPGHTIVSTLWDAMKALIEKREGK